MKHHSLSSSELSNYTKYIWFNPPEDDFFTQISFFSKCRIFWKFPHLRDSMQNCSGRNGTFGNTENRGIVFGRRSIYYEGVGGDDVVLVTLVVIPQLLLQIATPKKLLASGERSKRLVRYNKIVFKWIIFAMKELETKNVFHAGIFHFFFQNSDQVNFNEFLSLTFRY